MIGTLDRRSYPQRRLAAASLTASERVLYECPQGMTAVIMHMHFTSTHTGSETFRLWHVRQNEATSMANALMYDYSLSAKAYLSEDALVYLTAGEQIVASAGNASRITVSIYGVEQ